MRWGERRNLVRPARRRRWFRLVLVGLLAACGPTGQFTRAGDPVRQLGRGRQYADGWIAVGARGGEPTATAAIALGYLERQRLGLGSPFRLADYALSDPRLSEPERRAIAWAILARTADGDGDQVDPAALDAMAPDGTTGGGAAELELIDRAVSHARDPRAGELAVRLAYALAAAEGTLNPAAPALAAQVAALFRDRQLARYDARRLLAAASRQGIDALDLMREWRSERRFATEQPLAIPVSIEEETEAAELAPRLLAAIRTLDPEPDARPPESVPLLSPVAARRLAALADSLDAPPEPPVALSVRLHGRELLAAAAADTTDRSAERRATLDLLHGGRDEEHFVAEHAELWHAAGAESGVAARTVLAAAVGLRSYAQERPWFPGDAGPSESELEGQFGLTVSFEGDVPPSWRPYYRRMLATGLTDMERVLPSLSVRGLKVRIGRLPTGGRTPWEGRRTLALHDPRTRTLYLPPASGAGTLAHELAHDLDWQVALGRYHVRGDYATDRATRSGRDALAASISVLGDGALDPPMPGESRAADHDRRPAEVFARSVDWLVVVSLARSGRTDPYLSSLQDGVLTGFGSATPPDVSGRAGEALVDILDAVAPLTPDGRRWFLEQHGLGRSVSAYDLVRMVLEAPVPDDEGLSLPAGGAASAAEAEPGYALMAASGAGFAAIVRARDAALAALDGWLCKVPAAPYDGRLQADRRALVVAAAAARARGLALRRASDVAGSAGRRWVAREIFGDPWPDADIDSATAALLDRLVQRSRGPAMADTTPADRFRLALLPSRCAAGRLEAMP
jgi:hypothetical protein